MSMEKLWCLGSYAFRYLFSPSLSLPYSCHQYNSHTICVIQFSLKISCSPSVISYFPISKVGLHLLIRQFRKSVFAFFVTYLSSHSLYHKLFLYINYSLLNCVLLANPKGVVLYFHLFYNYL